MTSAMPSACFSTVFFCSYLASIVLCHTDDYRVKAKFEKYKIVPDAIDAAPEQLVQVTLRDGTKVDLGNEIFPRQTIGIPKINYEAQDRGRYTLLLVDLDAPSEIGNSTAPWEHWLVVNIQGSDVDSGEVKADYVRSGPGQNTSLHRYVYLIFQQRCAQVFKEPRLYNNSANGRYDFKLREFIQRNKLGNAKFGNFYRAQWDESVPELYKELGIS